MGGEKPRGRERRRGKRNSRTAGERGGRPEGTKKRRRGGAAEERAAKGDQAGNREGEGRDQPKA
jgi:hypothetical protein